MYAACRIAWVWNNLCRGGESIWQWFQWSTFGHGRSYYGLQQPWCLCINNLSQPWLHFALLSVYCFVSPDSQHVSHWHTIRNLKRSASVLSPSSASSLLNTCLARRATWRGSDISQPLFKLWTSHSDDELVSYLSQPHCSSLRCRLPQSFLWNVRLPLGRWDKG